MRWRVDAESELHRQRDEGAGAREPGIHLVTYCSLRFYLFIYLFTSTKVLQYKYKTKHCKPYRGNRGYLSVGLEYLKTNLELIITKIKFDNKSFQFYTSIHPCL